MRKLIDEICVAGLDVVEVAMRAGWWVERKEQGFPVVPKQQSQKLKAALIEALREIDLAWSKRGIDARGRLGVVGVR